MCRQDFVNEVNKDLRQLQNFLSSGSHFAFYAHSLKPNWNCWKISAYFDSFMENIFSHIICQHSQHACPLESNQQTHFDLQSQNKQKNPIHVIFLFYNCEKLCLSIIQSFFMKFFTYHSCYVQPESVIKNLTPWLCAFLSHALALTVVLLFLAH